MLAITLNPGFVLIFGALILLATPAALRLPVMIVAGGCAMWLLFDHEFGAAAAVAQIGLPVVLLDLDALNQVFGIAFIGSTILLAVYASARRHHFEDAAILLLAGGSVSALFVGDLISFLACTALAGLAAVWIVLASPYARAGASGVRLLIWHGLEGLLFLLGVAFHLSAGPANAAVERLDARTIGGLLMFAALLIRVGAPFAHVWLKDVVSHASAPGGVALTVFPAMLGVYALARLFPAEASLIPIGAAMIVLGVFFAAGEDDLRRAASYGLTAQIGVCVALIGLGSPLAMAGVAAHAFTLIFAFMLLAMALGMVASRAGAARASDLPGLGRRMPATALFMLVGGLAAAGMPWLGVYASLAVALEAASQWENRLIWLAFAGVSAALAICLALRPALLAFQSGPQKAPLHEAPFTMLLGTGLATFFCIAVGLTPAWLYRLTPTSVLNFDPYALDRLAPQLELIGVAGAVYIALRTMGLAPRERPIQLLDMDALYRGPIAGAGRWTGLVMLRLYGASRVALSAFLAYCGKGFSRWARACDRPYADSWGPAVQLSAIGVVLVIILLSRI